jgi:hypothetical protein
MSFLYWRCGMLAQPLKDAAQRMEMESHAAFDTLTVARHVRHKEAISEADGVASLSRPWHIVEFHVGATQERCRWCNSADLTSSRLRTDKQGR